MGYRSFRDEQGMDWQAWDVVPALADRRIQERRVHRRTLDDDRRRMNDRRVTPGHRPPVNAGMSGGWLCFEAAAGKRRLAPIPADWLGCAIERLRHYLAVAKPAARMTGPLTTQGIGRF
jgi:hypothetical protein